MTLAAPSATAAHPAAITSFLTQLAIALHKLRAYPPGHPMRRDAVESAFTMLESLLADRDVLRIGVARRELLIDDVPTDPAHFILRDLAYRLHRLQVGAVAFKEGVAIDEFALTLERLSVESSRMKGDELDAHLTFEAPHVEISRIAYQALSLNERGESTGEHADRVWQELAHLVATGQPLGDGFGLGDGDGSVELQGSEVLASALIDRLSNPEMRSAVAGTLERLGRVALTLEGEERRTVEVRLRDLLAAIPRDALSLLLNFDLQRPESLAALAQAAEWLPVTALIDLLESAAKAKAQEVSTLMLRLLRKLAGLGGGRTPNRIKSDVDFRTVVKGLLEDWSLVDPNPATHTRILDYLARHDLPVTNEGAPTTEGIRLIQMAIETDVFGDQVVEGVDLVLESRQLQQLIEVLEHSDPAKGTVKTVWSMLASPTVLGRILRDPESDFEPLGAVLAKADESVAPVLIDALFANTDTGRRRAIMGFLAGLGPSVPLEVLKRLDKVPLGERRVFLALLAELPDLPAGFSARAYADSPEPLIRLEACRLMLRNPNDRDDAIHNALADPDERVVRVAIDAGIEGLHRSALTRLMLLLNNPKRSLELRARAVSVLAQFDMPGVRHWLLEGTVVRRGWFRRRRLPAKTPLLLAKLTVLRERWPEHPDVLAVMRVAERSGDPEVQAVLRGGERS